MALSKITSASLADNAVTSDKISAGGIATADIANAAITPAKLSTGGPYWDSSSNVGIGTNSPNGKLQVKQANTAYGLVVEASGNDAWMRVHHNDSVGIVESTYDTTAGYTPLTFKTGGSEKLRILTSGGITFNGDTAAANALDDYEEGTFTITFTPDVSGTVTVNPSFSTMSYTKIGNIVTIFGNPRVSSVSSPVGNLKLNGLPFVVDSGTNVSRGGVSIAYYDNGASPGPYKSVPTFAQESTTAFTIITTDVGFTVGANDEMLISFSYRTS